MRFQYMAPQFASNASLAESPIDILLWTLPLKSHFADAAQFNRAESGHFFAVDKV
jgi:hypothetical protein